jgi:DUF917 family protein
MEVVVTVFSYDDIVDTVWGAGFLAGGGGGAVKWGLQMLRDYIESHGIKPADIKLSVYAVDEMPDDKNVYAAAVAGMGAPTAIKGDFSPWANNAFAAIRGFASKMDPARDIKYVLPVELGGFNTFIPMLIALENSDIYLLDVDASSRAVPALNTMLSSVNGDDTTPLALADDKNNKVYIDLADPKDATTAENLAREVTVQLGNIAGVSGWLLHRTEITATLGLNSLTLAKNIGHVLRDQTITDKFAAIQQYVKCRELFRGQVSDGKTAEQDGFDVGYETFLHDPCTRDFRIAFQNESLTVGNDGDKTPIMTAPDIIICLANDSRFDPYLPLTNSDFFDAGGEVIKGLSVIAGLVQVNQTWWKKGFDSINALWKNYFQNVGYNGDIIQYS